mgnify:CR=1 FL=1|tara:strand:- start:79 stop:825 length:747 start_codon:yes stop_codon:yes gene_type:complete
MKSIKISPKFKKFKNPKIGLIVLASDYIIEKDFQTVIKNKNIDLFVNRIESYNPLTKKNLVKMANKISKVTKDILPGEKVDCIAYACTSGTIAAGYNSIKTKVLKAKPNCKVTTPSTSSIIALRKHKIKKIALFTPYPKKLNDQVLEYFKKNNFIITSNSYFDISSDINIGKVNKKYLYKVLLNMNLNGAQAIFISCTALPALSIIDKLEKKLGIMVFSSNQTLIWDTLQNIGKKNNVKGFGKLMRTN